MGELQSNFYKKSHRIYQISFKKLPYLTDFNPQLMACMHWMAAQACLKNDFTEGEKYHNLMRWLIWTIVKKSASGAPVFFLALNWDQNWAPFPTPTSIFSFFPNCWLKIPKRWKIKKSSSWNSPEALKCSTFGPPHYKTNKMACAPSEDSDQPGHPPSLIRVFAVHSLCS